MNIYRFKDTLNKKFKNFRFILTPAGTALFIISLGVLIRALFTRNAYEIVLTSSALFLMLALGIIGLWNTRKFKSMEPNWKPPFPVTAFSGTNIPGSETFISGFTAFVPLFFRLHFIIRGRFFPFIKTDKYKGIKMRIEESIKRGETSSKININFPLSGKFEGDGFCQLRDIFGLFTFYYGLPQYRTINVRCSPCYGKKTQINAQSGAEDQRNKPAADIERYYMREYTPGDRFRDINWKSSEKIDALITRISTDNQEKISRLEIHFRNFGSVNQDNMEAIWLLDRAKARLTYFLRSLMEQNANYIFDIHSAENVWEIKDADELDVFFEELAVLSFVPPRHEVPASQKSDVYVFSTACDIGLSSFVLANNLRPVTLFLVQPCGGTDTETQEIEYLYLSGFEENGFSSSLKWLRKNIKKLNVQTAKTETFYAQVLLGINRGIKK
ncbi:MAG: DUF58 domain-containing protein [Treponema sp.]|nr:DUF58 domain-containing protein [Treponema sp.]